MGARQPRDDRIGTHHVIIPGPQRCPVVGTPLRTAHARVAKIVAGDRDRAPVLDGLTVR